jgi:hypothetical protein
MEPPNEDFKRKVRKQILLPNPALIIIPRRKEGVCRIQIPENILPFLAWVARFFCRHRDAGILLGYPSLLIRLVLDNPEEQHGDELAPWSFRGKQHYPGNPFRDSSRNCGRCNWYRWFSIK